MGAWAGIAAGAAEGLQRVELPRSGARAGMTADGASRPLPGVLAKVS